MIYMKPEDLRTVVLHFRRNHYTGEIEPICWAPFWYVWPTVHFVDWNAAQEYHTMPVCPNCFFPLTPTGYHGSNLNAADAETQEYWICRNCESKALGPHHKVFQYDDEPDAEAPTIKEGPTITQRMAASQSLDEKFKYLLKG